MTFFVLKYFAQETYFASLKKWFYSVTADVRPPEAVLTEAGRFLLKRI